MKYKNKKTLAIALCASIFFACLSASFNTVTEFESLGNHLRNLLSPYQTLVDVVQEYNDGEFDESEFKRIIGNAQLQDGIDKVIEFSKHPKMEQINWR